ncbi:9628_t:CDS:2, partial [Paraglomus brasilianum]
VSGLLLDLELESQKPKTKEPVFHSLNPFYKTFSYGYGFPHNTKIHKHGKQKNMEVLHFTGHDFSLWRNDKIVIFDKGFGKSKGFDAQDLSRDYGSSTLASIWLYTAVVSSCSLVDGKRLVFNSATMYNRP